MFGFPKGGKKRGGDPLPDVTPPDLTPNAFTLTDVNDAALSSLQTSNTITVAGLSSGVSVTALISGAASSELKKNSGSWGSASVTVANGDTLTVRHTSADDHDEATDTVLSVGGVTDTFTSTTLSLAEAVPLNTSAPRLMTSQVDGEEVTAPIVGMTLFLDPASWDNAPTDFTLQVYADDVAVPGADFTVSSSEPWESWVVYDSYEGDALKVGVIATNSEGDSTEEFSTATDPVAGVDLTDGIIITKTSADGVTPLTYTHAWGDNAFPGIYLRGAVYSEVGLSTLEDEVTFQLEAEHFDPAFDLAAHLASLGLQAVGATDYLVIGLRQMSPAGYGYEWDAPAISPQVSGAPPVFWDFAVSHADYASSSGGLVADKSTAFTGNKNVFSPMGLAGSYAEVTIANDGGFFDKIGLAIDGFSTTASPGDAAVNSIAYRSNGILDRWVSPDTPGSTSGLATFLNDTIGIYFSPTEKVYFFKNGTLIAPAGSDPVADTGGYDASGSYGTPRIICCTNGNLNFTLNGSGPFLWANAPSTGWQEA